MAFHPLFNTHPQYWYVSKFLEEADRQHCADDSFWLFYGQNSLWTVVIRLYIYFTDSILEGLSFRNLEN